jgi:hypothetical protein
LEVDTSLAVLAKCYVCGMESTGGADGDAFFARRDLVYLTIACMNPLLKTYHVETQPTLPLRLKHEEVHYAYYTPLGVFLRFMLCMTDA